jgi:hypothetical protein
MTPPSLTSAVDGGEWTASRTERYGSQKRSGHLGVEKNVPGLEPGPATL